MLTTNELNNMPRDRYGVILPYYPCFIAERLRDAWAVLRGRAQAIRQSRSTEQEQKP